MKTSNTNRFRRVGLSSAPAICLAASALTVGASADAQAEIISSGPLSQAAPVANVSIAGADRFSISNETGLGKGDSFRIALETLSPDFQYVGAGTAVTLLPAGEVVDASDAFSDDTPGRLVAGGEAIPSNWTGSGEAYFGFQFNPTGAQVLYGWARAQYDDNNGGKGGGAASLTLLEVAYEDSGAAITTGAVATPAPVPTLSEWWMIAFTTLLAALGAAAAYLTTRRQAVR